MRSDGSESVIIYRSNVDTLGVILLYLESMRELMKNPQDVLATISWREIFDRFESCIDSCEHVSECIGSVIMKNT